MKCSAGPTCFVDVNVEQGSGNILTSHIINTDAEAAAKSKMMDYFPAKLMAPEHWHKLFICLFVHYMFGLSRLSRCSSLKDVQMFALPRL